MISKEQIQHISTLARLGLTDKEIEKYQKELSAILDYVGKLKEVNISGIEPTSHSIKVENVMRHDEPGESNKKLIELAPERKEDYLKVKSILK
ncbi:MAG: Asp-tRNA(Asn)/Glu-tRNA(Gln) amidotransferase subunit GatC [Candidatus Nealsonbacteria bacterium]|nr:Asp-tRNA(Asn)/Glu-tRNA(Gln) amidotransferase subunit GatC [Candidatus Nealsonbacteria bacterium]